jgi:branched-chain amino acid transport system substrate-binding protein
VLLLGTTALAGCGGGYGYSGGGYGRYGGAPVPLSGGPPIGPGGPAGQRVAILLPLSGARADIGQGMLRAAQLAMDAQGAPPLDAKDTGGTPDGAAAAARGAIADGAGLILGPLTSPETAAVAPVARSANVAVLAFTNDPSQAQPGVWTLGITPGQQVRRLVAAAQGQGKTQFAALLPDSDFGHVMADALTRATAADSLPPPNLRFHTQGMQSINVTTRDLSDYASRGGPIYAQIKSLRESGTAEGRKQAHELARTASVPPPSFNVLLLADTGEALAEVASVLPYYDINRSQVQIIGPALWASQSSGSGQVPGAWYAAPDPAARAAFDQAYSAKYGGPAGPLGELAYDAASIARVLGTRGDFSVGALTQESGFLGADGWFALLTDGQVRRALAVFVVERGGPQMLEPAPQSGNVPGA